MSRIKERFRELKDRSCAALIAYITAGDPDLKTTEELARVLEDAGVDMIELGVPFSDPIADGPVIQEASERALRNGVSLRDVLGLARRLRQNLRVPLLAMTYYNPVYKYGPRFVADAVECGLDGVIIPDLPVEEAGELKSEALGSGLDTVFLLAPTSGEDRIKMVAQNSSGFIYYVSHTGVTGTSVEVDRELRLSVEKIKGMTTLPVAVGFGVSTPDQVAAVSRWADGVVVGSAIIRVMHRCEDGERLMDEVGEFVRSLASGKRRT
ncbi:MAG: tryptophan synthase subunit alpha [bacterium]